MNKKINIIMIAICIAVPLIVGFVSSLLTRDAMFQFNYLKKPLLSPPGFLFPIVWTILYVLMGIAVYIILNYKSDNVMTMSDRNIYIVLFVVQLIFNFFWTIIFFKYKLYYFAFVWLVILWILVLIMILKSFKINLAASIMLIPYLLWMTFAGYLNISIALLN